jgi:hypothetical protein
MVIALGIYFSVWTKVLLTRSAHGWMHRSLIIKIKIKIKIKRIWNV